MPITDCTFCLPLYNTPISAFSQEHLIHPFAFPLEHNSPILAAWTEPLRMLNPCPVSRMCEHASEVGPSHNNPSKDNLSLL